MARNRKTALQTGGGSPVDQEALDHMEEMVAAVIPEEIVTGIQGQDSVDYQETTQSCMADKNAQMLTVNRGGDTDHKMHGSHDIHEVAWVKEYGMGAWPVQREAGAHHNTTPTTVPWGYAAMPTM
ncbi:hypothetical protein NDU88_001721 [Pleurodeles waltl]|uniref:Uncharacterized protein n=1 Tax=Pleurodeles waltl TaxID=8319 RepID=A0AAV7RAQ5_PLEWA|nr:hypothetical protein NDU88_001721 [Pleurodeles waltl]